MRHLIRLCICNGFLQILLLLSLSQVIFAFSVKECFQLSARSGCDCFYNENAFEIACSAMTIQILTDIETNKDYNQIECKLTNFEYSENYEMDIGNCDYLKITDSHLSGEPITALLNHLGIKNVKHLIIYGNELGVSFNLLTGLSGLEKLSLFNNNLTQPPTNLSNVTTLNAYEKLVELPQHIFDHLEKLTELDLSFDGLDQLSNGIFDNQHNLKELNLRDNQLRNLKKTVFIGATSLQKLDLSFNSIEHFDPDVFSLLSNLTEINLSRYRLLELTTYFFVKNGNIAILSMDDKMELSQHMFDCLEKLTKIDLSLNDFEKLPDGIFRNQHKLKELDLTFNCIEHFDPDVFSLLSNLTEIDLSRNRLLELTTYFFVKNGNITILSMDDKMELSQHMFDCLEKLTKIDLSLNFFKKLPDGIFRNQHKLKELDLAVNRLSNLNKATFEGATSLQKLNLSLNGINYINPDVFTLLPNLSEIDLRGNYLYKVSSGLFGNNKNLNILHIDYELPRCDMCSFQYTKEHTIIAGEVEWQLPRYFVNNRYELKELNLSENRLRSLNKTVLNFELKLRGATSSEKVDLSFHHVSRKGVFSQLRDLLGTDLIGNNMYDLSSELFVESKNLSILRIYTEEEIEFPPLNLLAKLPHLQKAHISCNYLLQNKNFYDSSLSFHYKESHNRRSLAYVSCAIDKIPEDLFTNSGKWTYISLADNELRSLPVNLFPNQQNLYTLDLSYNKLESLECDLFNDTISLRRLTLECNQLTELPDDIFLSLDELEYLSLSKNRLDSLPDELFRGTSNLFKLKLSYNHLTNISAKIFSPLVKLEELYLDNNQLMSIDSNAFNESLSIRYINMENNLITLKDPYNVLKSPFHFLLKLQILKLRSNAVEYICWDWKNVFPKLKEFDLSFNRITTLNYSCFQFDTNGLFVNMSYNQVRTINVAGSELAENLISNTYYNSIDLNYNPLDCDCKLVSFLSYLRKISHYKINFIINNLICDKPYGISLRPIRELKPEKLLCPIGQPHCPLGCKCWKRTYDATLIVNCSNTNLNEVPELSLVQTFALETIELYVENNKLLKLPTKSLLGYANVTKIYAARNNISQIDVNNMPTKLIHLDLSHNNLKRLDDDVIELFIQSLTQIALAGNPWDCNCANKALMLFVHRRSNWISDYKIIVCATPTNFSMPDYLIDNNLCQEDHHVLITLIICFSVFSLLIVVAVAFYYKNKTEIKIWMYRYPWLRRFVSEDEVDKNRNYDAFISYAHEDQEFVGRTLVPELEQNGPIRYKLCVHVRDFTVGESILKQIVGAIDESKRTIFVLSNHFIQSAWACMEFRLAHKAALNEGRARIIVIVYGDIGDIDLLDPLLRAYLRMNTYLEWGDPWFWDRLRFAMPHSVNAPPVESYQATTAV